MCVKEALRSSQRGRGGAGDFDKLSVERQIEKLRVAEIKTARGYTHGDPVDDREREFCIRL